MFKRKVTIKYWSNGKMKKEKVSKEFFDSYNTVYIGNHVRKMLLGANDGPKVDKKIADLKEGKTVEINGDLWDLWGLFYDTFM